MDPRNFLDENYIFQFLLQSYDGSVHTIEGLNTMLKGTFMEGGLRGCGGDGSLRGMAAGRAGGQQNGGSQDGSAQNGGRRSEHRRGTGRLRRNRDVRGRHRLPARHRPPGRRRAPAAVGTAGGTAAPPADATGSGASESSSSQEGGCEL